MQVKGYQLVRLLSDRERTKLYIAKTVDGLCAIKFQIPKEPSKLGELVRRDALLLSLSQHAGLTEILASGETEDGWAWEALTLADNLSASASPGVDRGVDHYTPFTFGAWSSIYGRPSARQVAQMGIRLANGLGVLHGAGLVHRDVKPTNILIISGEPCIGDYELVGPPGEAVDYRGTEGYRPIEGTNDVSADLFGLGKSLYEAWTGGSRLEFPSLPKSILQAPEWDKEGCLLNEVICRACDVQPRRRFHSAGQLSAALTDVLSLRRPLSRRRWLIAATSGTALSLAAVLNWKYRKAPAQVAWRCVREKGFNVEAWAGTAWSVDWSRNKMYSAKNLPGGSLAIQSLDLRDFTIVSKELSQSFLINCRFMFHPETHELWLWEGGNGNMCTLNPQTLELRLLGGGPDDRRRFGALTYWNPTTKRVGIYGGYGMLSVTNSRFEFDGPQKGWIEIEKDGAENAPWRRSTGIQLAPDLTGKKLYLVGGHGSPTGKQGDRIAGLGGFNGQFHVLDDIWELNLGTNEWKCLLPIGSLNPSRIRLATYLPKLHALVVVESGKLSEESAQPAQTWLLRLGIDKKPILLPTTGTIPQLIHVWSYTVDPVNQETLVVASDGIFRAAIEPA